MVLRSFECSRAQKRCYERCERSHIQLSERVVCIITITQRHWLHLCRTLVIRFTASIFFIHLILCSWSCVGRASKSHDTGLPQMRPPIHFSSQPRIQRVTARASEPNSFIEFIIYFKNRDVFFLNPDAFYFYRFSLLLLFIINWRFWLGPKSFELYMRYGIMSCAFRYIWR